MRETFTRQTYPVIPMEGGSVFRSEDSYLEGRRSRLQLGPIAEDFALPAGLAIESTREACRFRGPAGAVALLRNEFKKLERSPSGSEARVYGWTFRVQDEPPEIPEENVIILPWDSWGMVGTLLSDVAYGYDPNPFVFSEVGYICLVAEDGIRLPRPRPDIEVIVDGPLLVNDPVG
jgi:hypothetical protein